MQSEGVWPDMSYLFSDLLELEAEFCLSCKLILKSSPYGQHWGGKMKWSAGLCQCVAPPVDAPKQLSLPLSSDGQNAAAIDGC
jgi:hypothetical protein